MIMISERMRNFFERELENYSENVRNGNIDPSDGFHPTVQTALDSLDQAPYDVKDKWMGLGADLSMAYSESVYQFMSELAWLIAMDRNASLVSLLEQDVPYVDREKV